VRALDRYLAREILLPFVAGLVFLTQLLVATQLLAQAEVIFGSGVSAWDIGAVVLALTPHFLGYVLPVAFLLGAVLGVGRLAEDREVVALGAAGISPATLVRTPVILGVVVSIAALALSLWVEPAGLRSARLRLNDVIRRNLTNDVRGGVFFEDVPNLTVYVESARHGRWTNVLISDRSDPRAPLLALARGGALEPAGEGDALRLTLEEGEVHREEAAGAQGGAEAQYVRGRFERGEVVIGAGKSVSERNKLGGSRFELGPRQIRERAAERAAAGDALEARKWRSFLHRKIAGPIAILAFGLLAAPIAAARRGGRAAGYVLTLLAVVSYYAVLRFGEQLGQNGALPVWLGPQVANLLVASIGLLLTWRMARRGPEAVR
jgi:lipopolysaccharide export system permease protein